jgi:hypothetical protein
MKISKVFPLLLIFCVIAQDQFAAKKRKTVSREIVTCQSATYSFVHNNIRTVGNIYELNITVNANDVTIDSVWFGATPVPCDIYETRTLQRVASPVLHGKYLIKANKDLYANFYRNIDSTFAYNHFVPPFPFKGELVIMYSYKGKRYYKTIKNVEERAQKRMRE